jgi:hypothetical protein
LNLDDAAGLAKVVASDGKCARLSHILELVERAVFPVWIDPAALTGDSLSRLDSKEESVE